MMQGDCIILSVKKYDFKNDEGQQITGAKVSYVNLVPSAESSIEGCPPIQVSIDTSLINTFKDLPCHAQIQYTMGVGKNNKPELKVSGFKYLSPVNFNSLIKD